MNVPIMVIKITEDIDSAEYADILADIMIAVWRSAFQGILSDPIIKQYTQRDDCTAMFSQILASGQGHMYLAFMDQKPAGLLYWQESTYADIHLEALLTIPDAWGFGVGSGLLDAALSDMANTECQAVHVWPFTENRRARRFYEKHGFRPTGQERTGDAPETEYLLYL